MSCGLTFISAWMRHRGRHRRITFRPPPRSCVLSFFDESIWALDGDGSGYGVYTNIAPAIFKESAAAYVRVTLRQDYANRVYDVWVNRVLRARDLGFKDFGVDAFHFLCRRTGDFPSFVDDITVSPFGLDLDLDKDGVADLDEVRHGFHPDFSDRDGDGLPDSMNYAQEMAARVPGYRLNPWALPQNGSTYLNLHRAGRQWDLRFPAMTTFLYRSEQRRDLVNGEWAPVPGYESGTPGADAVLGVSLDVLDPHGFYRVVTEPAP